MHFGDHGRALDRALVNREGHHVRSGVIGEGR